MNDEKNDAAIRDIAGVEGVVNTPIPNSESFPVYERADWVVKYAGIVGLAVSVFAWFLMRNIYSITETFFYYRVAGIVILGAAPFGFAVLAIKRHFCFKRVNDDNPKYYEYVIRGECNAYIKYAYVICNWVFFGSIAFAISLSTLGLFFVQVLVK